MFCPNCGTKNEDDAVFCANCGTSLAEVREMPAQENGAAQTAPVQNVTPEQNAVPVQNAAPIQKAPRKPLSKNTIIGIVAGVVVLLAVIIFVVVGNSKNDYLSIAKNYVKAVEECDWEAVYKYVDIPEATFLTKDLFMEANKDEYKTEISNVSAEDRTDSLDAPEGTKRIRVNYYEKGSIGNSEYVTLIKQEKNSMLFWSNYKISAADFVSKDCKVRVLKGAKLFVDNVEVPASFLDISAEAKSSTKYDTYIIDYLFNGSHTFKVTQENMEDQERVKEIDYDSASLSMTEAKIQASMLEILKKSAEEVNQKFYAAAIDRKEFSTLEDLFVNDSTIRNKMKSSYESFRNNQKTEDGYGLLSVSFSNVTMETTQTTSDDYFAVRVSVKAPLKASVLSKTYSSTKPAETKDKSGTVTNTFYYRYQDGAWKLYNFAIDRVSY